MSRRNITVCFTQIHSDLRPSFSQLAIHNKIAVMAATKECFPAVTLVALIM